MTFIIAALLAAILLVMLLGRERGASVLASGAVILGQLAIMAVLLVAVVILAIWYLHARNAGVAH